MRTKNNSLKELSATHVEQLRTGRHEIVNLLIVLGKLPAKGYRNALAAVLKVPRWKVSDVMRVHDYGFDLQAMSRLRNFTAGLPVAISVFDAQWCRFGMHQSPFAAGDDSRNWGEGEVVARLGDVELLKFATLSGVALQLRGQQTLAISYPLSFSLLTPCEVSMGPNVRIVAIGVETSLLFLRCECMRGSFRCLVQFGSKLDGTVMFSVTELVRESEQLALDLR